VFRAFPPMTAGSPQLRAAWMLHRIRPRIVGEPARLLTFVPFAIRLVHGHRRGTHRDTAAYDEERAGAA
jgi:hypothetical protein